MNLSKSLTTWVRLTKYKCFVILDKSDIQLRTYECPQDQRRMPKPDNLQSGLVDVSDDCVFAVSPTSEICISGFNEPVTKLVYVV